MRVDGERISEGWVEKVTAGRIKLIVTGDNPG